MPQNETFPEKGFSLIELMVTLVILQIVIIPLYMAFSGSRQMMVSAREMSTGVGYASSLIAGLRGLDPAKLQEIPPTQEADLPDVFSLTTLGLEKAREGFSRTLTIGLADPTGKDGGPFYEATVEIKWRINKQKNAPETGFVMKSILVRKK